MICLNFIAAISVLGFSAMISSKLFLSSSFSLVLILSSNSTSSLAASIFALVQGNGLPHL
jgi:hypothetical protein